MAKFKVKCWETAVYEFTVEAEDEDDAWFKAHDVLLGTEDTDGAIRLVPPDGTPIQCDVPDREWEFTEEE